ncbi:MAG: DNA polymerase I [Oscillospiraceae bacterium]|nr:DNA polymerase I [Oscillospiraceae bacterium]
MKLMILDGNSVVNRAFYGVGYLSSRSGQPTGAIYGFLNIMQSLLDEEHPDALCVAFDEKGPTFRHEEYEGYKATRKPMPEDLASQMPILKEILSAMNVPMYSLSGWEADDILGTAGKICGSEGWDCVVVTGDRDSLQLVDVHVTVKLVTTKGGRTQSVNYTPQVFESEYGFPPKGLIDLKALMGDSSDNYPGVPGIGEKTAKDLMAKFGSLDNVYANAEDDSLKPAVKRKLAEGKESAYQSYDLATIRCSAPISFTPEDNRIRKWDRAKVLELFRQLEFGRLIEKYRLLEPDEDSTPAEETKLNVIEVTTPETIAELQSAMRFIRPVGVAVTEHLDGFALAVGDTVYTALETDLGLVDYPLLLEQLWGTDVKKICHDSKSIRSELLRRGIQADGIEYDTALGAYLLEPARSRYNPTDLAQQYCGRTLPEDLSGQAAAVLALGTALPKLVRANGMEAVYRDIDFPLCPVLAEMESTGIAVDKNTLESFGAMLSERIRDCENLIYGYAGGPFNINSTKQLGTLLFETLGLPHGKKTKSGYSTNIDVLEQLREKHPIIPAIIDYRMLTKLHSTYAEGLLKVIAPDGRIHSTFQNTVTATGRLSSTDPNLQNIPVRTELGGEIRKMFVARPGWVLVDADYSQIELRVLAHVADDKAMQDAFCSGEDFHTHTAAQVFGVAPEEVTPQMRRSAKAVNFGIVYGISDFSLAGDIGVSRKEAKAYIDGYLSHYAGVRQYMEDVVKNAKESGYVESMYGRRRQLPELHSSNFNVRSGAERMALNTPIQGTAADIIKIAMIRVRDRMMREGLQAKLVLQVHDELIVECPETEKDTVLSLVTEEMEAAASLKVPLIAEAHAGQNWYEAK